MTARRTTTAVAALMASVPNWIELTMVVREEQVASPSAHHNGEDDDDGANLEARITIVEIVTKAKLQRNYVRYFYGRRDDQPGSEIHFTNGHVMIVQEPLAAVKALLPGFVETHVSGAPSEVLINPTKVRFMHGHVAQLGSNEVQPGTRLTFPNGNKLEVTESYDELAPQFGIN